MDSSSTILSEHADLAKDTAVRKVDKVPGLYVADLTDSWNYLKPSGGALLTVALRAMTAEVGDPELRLLSATSLFASPILAGELVVSVTVIRRSDNAAQLRATLTASKQPGPGLEAIATFARDRSGPDVLGVDMPKVPAPADSRLIGAKRLERDNVLKRTEFTFYRNVEMAQALGADLWAPGAKAGDAHAAFWHRYRVPQRDADGNFDMLAIPPIADTMPSALAQKLGPDAPPWIAPSLDLTVYFLEPTKSEWILVESFAERARAGFAVASANLWSEDGRLVARSTQSMTLRSAKRG